MTTTPQAALLSAQNPLLKRCYTMSEPHLSGYRVVIGFERLEDAQDAHEYIAKLQATQEPVQAGELPPLPFPNDHNGFGRCPDRYTADQMYAYARSALSARKPLTPLIARQLGEWHEDDGPVMWWAWNGHGWAGEPAWCGQPTDSDWPGYHTHWTPHPQQPATNGIGLEVKP